MEELVIFDLDNVLIKEHSHKALLDYLFQQKLVGSFCYLKNCIGFYFYKKGWIKNSKRIIGHSFGFLKNQRKEEMTEILNVFFENILKKNIFGEMVEIINEHKKNNRKLILVSGALRSIVEKTAEFLKIDHCIGTSPEIVNNKFTGRTIGEIAYGKNKVKYIDLFVKQKNMSPKNIWSYANHISDLGILEFASIPVAVNPDRFLYKMAKKRKWSILLFNKTYL